MIKSPFGGIARDCVMAMARLLAGWRSWPWHIVLYTVTRNVSSSFRGRSRSGKVRRAGVCAKRASFFDEGRDNHRDDNRRFCDAGISETDGSPQVRRGRGGVRSTYSVR